jgi:hypothetical protein
MKKQMQQARAFFDASIQKGQQNAISTMFGDGFDGVNYQRVFKVRANDGFASMPTPVALGDAKSGQAKILGANATDFPTVAVATSGSMMQNGDLIGIGVISNYRDAELARKGNTNIIAKETERAYETIELLHQAIAWGTDGVALAAGLLGFSNHPNILKSQFQVGSTSVKLKWAEKEPNEISNDIVSAINDFYALRPELEQSGVILEFHLSTVQFNLLRTKMITNEVSVLQHLKKYLPENGFNLEFKVTNNMGSSVAIGDFRSSSMEYHIPMTTEVLPTTETGMVLRANFVAESKGLVVEKANSAIIYEGVA